MNTDSRFARPTPFARLLYAHAVMVCGDAALTVSLAGSLFFQSPTSAARGKLLLYLVITMLPFAVVAPILGPALDRIKGGRRLLIVGSAAGRAALCLVMALYISKPAPEGLLVYPLAFGVLVLAKGYQIAKSALLPSLVTSDAELVSANSRLALVALIGASVGALPAAGIQQLFGADWSLRFAAIVFVDRGDPRDQDPAARAHVRSPTSVRSCWRRPSSTSRASCSRAARWRCSAAASASCSSSPRSRSRTTSSRSAPSASRAGSVGSSA